MKLADQLIAMLGPEREHTAIVFSAEYQPVGGDGRTVMPPTYPVDDTERSSPGRGNGQSKPLPQYLTAKRLVDGAPREVVTLDQEPSQANRIEEALLAARDAGRLQLPLFEMRTAAPPLGEVRLTSLDFPHRYADAYLRDSMVNGVCFDDSGPGQRLRSANTSDVRPLYEREPCSLILGAWDSHRKGRWPRFARLYVAMMYGLDPAEGCRMGGRVDPVNLTGSVVDPAKVGTGDGWAFSPVATGEKKKKLSSAGHGHIKPNPAPGGVTVSGIRRQASISLAGLERLRFGDASREAATLGRATLAALALAGDRLAFGAPSTWLRSGCDLAKTSEVVGLERPGGAVDELTITAADALDAYHGLRERAVAAGLPMADDVIQVTPIKGLRDAIVYAVTAGSQADEGTE
jgi:CRISPR-associated protein Csb1